MEELPLFPLNVVLFPGMPLPLQIFEERYKEMIGMCIRERRPFGVVLIREGLAEHGPLAEPHRVGCTAEIVQVQQLDEHGRLLIITVGQERFRILSLRHDKPYLVGQVEMVPLIVGDKKRAAAAAAQLYPLVVEYLQILSRLEELDFDVTQVPREPEELIYLAAAAIQLPPDEKQALLVIENAAPLLRLLQAVYRRELPLMRLSPPADQGVFSLN